MALGGVPVPAQPAACQEHDWRYDRVRGPVCTRCDQEKPPPLARATAITELESNAAFREGALAAMSLAGASHADWNDLEVGTSPDLPHVASTVTAAALNDALQANAAGVAAPLDSAPHLTDLAGRYGRVDVPRWNAIKAITHDEVQVLLDGVDVTGKCKAANDIEGWAEVRRANLADIPVLGAFERRVGHVVMRPYPVDGRPSSPGMDLVTGSALGPMPAPEVHPHMAALVTQCDGEDRPHMLVVSMPSGVRECRRCRMRFAGNPAPPHANRPPCQASGQWHDFVRRSQVGGFGCSACGWPAPETHTDVSVSCTMFNEAHHWAPMDSSTAICTRCGTRNHSAAPWPGGYLMHSCPAKGQWLRWEDCGHLVLAYHASGVGIDYQRCVHCGERRDLPSQERVP